MMPMMPRWIGLVAVMTVGCVNGDDSMGVPQGALGGPCFANGTCNTGLACTPEGNTLVCETPDATVDAAGDQGATDGGSDAADAASCNLTAAPACNGNCPPAMGGCCQLEGTCAGFDVDASPNPCPGGELVWDCESNVDCTGATSHCCMYANVIDAGACPPLDMVMGAPMCAPACGAGSSQLCVSTADCSNSQKCVAVSFGSSHLVGLCM
jgi:hypothetical protein